MTNDLLELVNNIIIYSREEGSGKGEGERGGEELKFNTIVECLRKLWPIKLLSFNYH